MGCVRRGGAERRRRVRNRGRLSESVPEEGSKIPVSSDRLFQHKAATDA